MAWDEVKPIRDKGAKKASLKERRNLKAHHHQQKQEQMFAKVEVPAEKPQAEEKVVDSAKLKAC